MVLQKRLDYGFNGYQVPSIPRSSRSVRGGRLFKKKVENNQMCAFELLATVAGKLLQERESSHAHSNALARRAQPTIVKGAIKQEQQNEKKLLKVEPCDPGSCDESVLASDLSSLEHNQNFISKENEQNDVGLELTSIIANSDCAEKVGCAELTIGKSRNGFGKFPSRVEGGPPGYGESCKGKVVDGIERQLESEIKNISSVINGTVLDTCSSEYPMELDNKAPLLVSSDSCIELPMYRNHIPCSCKPGFRDDVKVGSKDDDENSSVCTQPSTITMKAFRPSPRIGDRRIRKLLASKYWNVAPKLKDGELSNTDVRHVFRNRKTCFTRKRSQRNSPFKKRKLFEHNSISTSEGLNSSEGISNSLEKGINGDATGSVSRESSSVAGQESSFHSRGSHVKLSIKSFRVPELFIEIPETATVGSLKRTVMEAMNAILGRGLRVGVILQGKNIRDDNKTLMQTGISHDDKLNTLGFTLEPNSGPAPSSPPVCHEDPQFLVPCDTPRPLTRYLTTPALDPGTFDASPYLPVINLGNCVESDHDLVPSSTDMSADGAIPDSRELVAIPTCMEALSVVPLHRKSKRSELIRRRIRRPFSVSEVEALVQAVEKLGTGRWRDIKLRAFDNAKHRTYVDLKDKWKTLVHTARISPQQRRGEPVPQELLDRVLAVHAYWSQQQAKQQIKQQQQQQQQLTEMGHSPLNLL